MATVLFIQVVLQKAVWTHKVCGIISHQTGRKLLFVLPVLFLSPVLIAFSATRYSWIEFKIHRHNKNREMKITENISCIYVSIRTIFMPYYVMFMCSCWIGTLRWNSFNLICMYCSCGDGQSDKLVYPLLRLTHTLKCWDSFKKFCRERRRENTSVST